MQLEEPDTDIHNGIIFLGERWGVFVVFLRN